VEITDGVFVNNGDSYTSSPYFFPAPSITILFYQYISAISN
jgi:hypothetical protein